MAIDRSPFKALPNCYDYPLEPDLVRWVKAAIREVGGDFSIKSKDQVFITEDGFGNLIGYPFDPLLLALALPSKSDSLDRARRHQEKSRFQAEVFNSIRIAATRTDAAGAKTVIKPEIYSGQNPWTDAEIHGHSASSMRGKTPANRPIHEFLTTTHIPYCIN